MISAGVSCKRLKPLTESTTIPTEGNQSMRQEKKSPDHKKKAHQTSEIGSFAISMTYGEYLKKYPRGNRDDSAKNEDLGYVIISKRDSSNINWLSRKAFNTMNKAFARLPKA